MESTLATLETAHALTPIGARSVSWSVAVETWLRVRDLAANSRRAYARALARFFEVTGRETPLELTAEDLLCYREALGHLALAPKSVALELAAVRSFLRWARKPHVAVAALHPEVIEEALPVPRRKVETPRNVATEPEILALFEAATTPRDSALLAVMIGGGLRVSEVVGLDVADLIEHATGGADLHVRNGKGAKDRLVPIGADVLRELRRYLAATGRDLRDPGALFRAHDRGASKRDRRRMTARAVGNVLAVLISRASIEGKKLSPHSLRHTFATRFLRGGGSIVAAAMVLGHASTSTTELYVRHLEREDLAANMPLLPIRARHAA